MSFLSAIQFTVLILSILQQGTATSKRSTCETSEASALASQQWYHLNGEATRSFTTAILPLGAIEYHGPHLPLGTDALLADRFVTEASNDWSDVAVLPPVYYGASFEHANFPGTIAVEDAHFNGLIGNILSALAKSGIKKVILVNAHGGQTPNVDIAARTARFHHNILAVTFNVQAMMSRALAKFEPGLEEEIQYGIHGGLIETSVMLHWFPNLVHRHAFKHFKSRWMSQSSILQPHDAVVSYGWCSEDLSSTGALGDASTATGKRGRAIIEHTTSALRSLIQEVHRADVDDVLKVKST